MMCGALRARDRYAVMRNERPDGDRGEETSKPASGLPKPAIELEGIRKVYGNGVVAVDELNLVIGDGEFLVLVGPSGCGKTTVLRMLAGLENISGGKLRMNGRDVVNVLPKDRDIAMVFQSYALYPHMTVMENLEFALKVRKIGRVERVRKVENVARMLGLVEYLDRKPGQLSGGQRQRVAMGRALVREPRAFLMDEPLSNLDAKLRVQMRAEVRRLQRELGITTIYVTHDQVEAMTMGDRVAVMKSGRLQQCDEPRVLYDRPENLFVALFMGSPAMNVYRAKLSRELHELRFSRGGMVLGCDVQDNVIEAHKGRDVVVGFRPEDVSIDPANGNDGVPGDVELVESLGSETMIYIRIDEMVPLHVDANGSVIMDDAENVEIGVGRLTVCRDSGSVKVSPGDKVKVLFAVQRAHMFDLNSGARLGGFSARHKKSSCAGDSSTSAL